MRRILIDNRISNLAKKYSEGLFVDSRDNKIDMPLDRLRALYGRLEAHGGYHEYAMYVWNIIVHYRDILRLEPQDFFEYYILYFGDLTDKEIAQKIDIEYFDGENPSIKVPQGKQFNELVQWALRYKDLRAVDYLYYFKELNIRTCVYCNAQYAVVLEDVNDKDKDGNDVTKTIARFQLDHFWPESEYPFLCTSFFNLQPSCANCNLHKFDKKSLFNLYTRKEEDVNVFWFKFSTGDNVDGVNGYNYKNLKITLDSNNKKLLANHQDRFLIDDIYKHHCKEAQETIVRLKINDDAYRRQLGNSLKLLFPDGVEQPERFFWGHEIDEEYVHERPLNKLVQDAIKYYVDYDKQE